jgi:hypothetical protein
MFLPDTLALYGYPLAIFLPALCPPVYPRRIGALVALDQTSIRCSTSQESDSAGLYRSNLSAQRFEGTHRVTIRMRNTILR